MRKDRDGRRMTHLKIYSLDSPPPFFFFDSSPPLPSLPESSIISALLAPLALPRPRPRAFPRLRPRLPRIGGAPEDAERELRSRPLICSESFRANASSPAVDSLADFADEWPPRPSIEARRRFLGATGGSADAVRPPSASPSSSCWKPISSDTLAKLLELGLSIAALLALTNSCGTSSCSSKRRRTRLAEMVLRSVPGAERMAWIRGSRSGTCMTRFQNLE